MPAAKHAGAVHAGVMANKSASSGRKHRKSKRR